MSTVSCVTSSPSSGEYSEENYLSVSQWAQQLAGYGQPGLQQWDNFEDAILMIERSSRMEMGTARNWIVHLWKSGYANQHHALCFSPDPMFELDVDSEMLHPTVSADVLDEETQTVKAARFTIAFELAVDKDKETFFPITGIVPGFTPERPSMVLLGRTEKMPFPELAELARATVRQYKTYGLLGANCQHFAQEVSEKLGLERNSTESELVPMDERIVTGFSSVTASLMEGAGHIVKLGGTWAGISLGFAVGLTYGVGIAVPAALVGSADCFRYHVLGTSDGEVMYACQSGIETAIAAPSAGVALGTRLVLQATSCVHEVVKAPEIVKQVVEAPYRHIKEQQRISKMDLAFRELAFRDEGDGDLGRPRR